MFKNDLDPKKTRFLSHFFDPSLTEQPFLTIKKVYFLMNLPHSLKGNSYEKEISSSGADVKRTRGLLR